MTTKTRKKTKKQIEEEFNLATTNAVLQFARIQKIKTRAKKPTINTGLYFIFVSIGRYEEATEMLIKFIKESLAFIEKYQPVKKEE